MHDDDKKEVEEAKAQGAEPTGTKRPLRGRNAKSRRAIEDLAFMIHEGLRQDAIAPMTRAKLLAWAGMHGKKE